MEYKVLKENGYVVLYYPQSSKWIRMKEIDYNKLLENYTKEEIISYYKLNKNKKVNDGKSFNSIYISLTNACNMNCKFCASKILDIKNNAEVHEKHLTVDEVNKKIIPFLKDKTIKKMILTGGEPFCNPEFLEICESLSEYIGKEQVILETNGIDMTEDLTEKTAKWIGKVEISIENVMNSQELMEHISKITKIFKMQNVEVTYSYVLSKKSLLDYKNAIDFCDTNQAYFNYRFVQPFDHSIEELILSKKDIRNIYDTFFEYLKDKRNVNKKNYNMELIVNNILPKGKCNAFGKTIAILPDGKMTICINLQDELYEVCNVKEYNKYDANIVKTFENPELLRRFDLSNHSECSKCRYIDFCGGLCIGSEGYSKKYDINECNIRKAIIRYNLFSHKEDSIDSSAQTFSEVLYKYF